MSNNAVRATIESQEMFGVPFTRARFESKEKLYTFLHNVLHDPNLYFPEISVVNSSPKEYDKAYLFPRDSFLSDYGQQLMNADLEQFIRLCKRIATERNFGAFYAVVSVDKTDTKRAVVMITELDLMNCQASVNAPIWGKVEDIKKFIRDHE